MAEDAVQRECAGHLQVRTKLRGSMTKAREELFLKELGETANITRSAAAAGVSIYTIYRHRKRSAEFDDAVRAAIDLGIDRLEVEMLDLALNGVENPIIYQGKETGRARLRSERLMIFLLQAHRPEVYGPMAFRARSRDDVLPAPVANVEEARARILKLMEEMDAREGDGGVVEVKAPKLDAAAPLNDSN